MKEMKNLGFLLKSYGEIQGSDKVLPPCRCPSQSLPMTGIAHLYRAGCDAMEEPAVITAQGETTS